MSGPLWPDFVRCHFPRAVDQHGAAVPVLGAVRQAQFMGDLGQAVAGGPAHQHGRGVDPGPRAQLPHARVRLSPGVGALVRKLRQLLGAGAVEDVAAADEARGGLKDVAEYAVLGLVGGAITRDDRTRALIAMPAR